MSLWKICIQRQTRDGWVHEWDASIGTKMNNKTGSTRSSGREGEKDTHTERESKDFII